MKYIPLNNYIEYLQEIIKKDPKAISYNVVYGIDEEGNEYKPVCMKPCAIKANILPFLDPPEKIGTKVICIN